MKIRRDTPPASSTDLQASHDDLAGQIEQLGRERDKLEAGLVSGQSPVDMIAASDRLAQIDVMLPHKRRALLLIEKEVANARDREAKQGVLARIAAQDQKSTRLARDLARRYRAASDALAAILREIAEDNDAARALSREASSLGLKGIWSAEYRLRRENPNAVRNGFESVADASRIASWDGHRLEWAGNAPNGGAGRL